MKDDNNEVLKYTKWKLQGGMQVCRKFWCMANACSHSTVEMMKKAMKAGHSTPPPQLPRVPTPRSGERKFSVDAFFIMYYKSLAEPMPVSDPCQPLALDPDEAENHLLDCPDHPLWSVGIAIQGTKGRYVPKRYLNPGSAEGLWSLYEQDDSTDKVISEVFLATHAKHSRLTNTTSQGSIALLDGRSQTPPTTSIFPPLACLFPF